MSVKTSQKPHWRDFVLGYFDCSKLIQNCTQLKFTSSVLLVMQERWELLVCLFGFFFIASVLIHIQGLNNLVLPRAAKVSGTPGHIP